MKSLQGHLLVASPRLQDPNFFKAVVLLVQHTEGGALGLILNRPLDLTVKSAWDQVSQTPCLAGGLLHQGGPCEGPLMVVHTEAGQSGIEVAPGLHFSTERDAVEHVAARGNETRFFVGYAGWGPGQLDGELDQGGWLTAPATPQVVFGDPDGQWDALLKAVGRQAPFPWINPALMPDDPSMN